MRFESQLCAPVCLIFFAQSQKPCALPRLSFLPYFFEAHGPKTILLARFVPVVRTFAPILAGVGEMPYRTFFRFNVVGGFVWAVGVTTAGYVLGSTIPSIDRYLLPIIFVIVLISVIPPFLEWRRHRKAVPPVSEAEAEHEAEELQDLLDGED